MSNTFSKQIKDILKSSRDEAIRLNSVVITPEHLLLGILKEKHSHACAIIEEMGVKTDKLAAYLEAELIDAESTDRDSINESTDIVANSEVSEMLSRTLMEAQRHHAKEADSQHLLLALASSIENSFATQILEKMNVNYSNIDDYLDTHQFLSGNEDKQQSSTPQAGADFADEEEDDDDQMSHFGDNDSASGAGKASATRRTATSRPDTPVLDKYGKDLTKQAETGHLDPVIGRDREIERLSQILSRRKKNNPVLIGEPGVGKSAIVEGLAIRICQRKVARILQNKRIFALDMASVVAGTKYRGQFEERIKAIIDEVAQNPDIIPTSFCLSTRFTP